MVTKEGGKEGEQQEGRMERSKEGRVRIKELEKISDIWYFGLTIQSKYIVSGHQNSRTSEIEEKLRNEDVTFKVLQDKVHKKPGVQ